MRTVRRLTPGDQSASRVRQSWAGEMNFRPANTFPFRRSPRLFNAQVGERRLPARKLLVSCWIAMSEMGLRKTVPRFSQARRFRVTSLLLLLPRLARFHL